jgi:aryl-alcohol dehydrogenase-like predicted oxidoreductase
MQSLVRSEPRPLGSIGPVGPIAFGLWRFTDPDLSRARLLIETALEAGMNLIDTADVYGLDWGGSGFGDAERLLGQVLTKSPQLRDQMVLATKGGIRPPVPYDSSPTRLREACEASLTRLGVPTIDLYQIHRPDPFTHPEEVAAVLTALRSEGKILEAGVSNHTPAQIETLQSFLDFDLVSHQPEYSAAHLEPLRDGTLDQCLRTKMTPLAWSPLAQGALAGEAGSRHDAIRPELLDVLDQLAEREWVERATIALAFVLAHPAQPVAIIGTQRPERIGQARRALSVTLNRTDVYRIIEASDGVPLP